MSKKALIYTRVSTSRQANEGIGLEAQLSRCQAHAERLGWTVEGVFTDAGISGRDGIKSRPGLKSLLETAKRTPGAVVVVYSVSRLARSQRLLCQLLDDKDGEGLEISSATEAFDTTTPTGRAMLGMLSVFAQLEADMASERIRDALAELKAQGKTFGQKPMIDLSPDLTRRVFDLYNTKQYSLRTLADHLNTQQIPTPTGRGKWWPRTVKVAVKSWKIRTLQARI